MMTVDENLTLSNDAVPKSKWRNTLNVVIIFVSVCVFPLLAKKNNQSFTFHVPESPLSSDKPQPSHRSQT